MLLQYRQILYLLLQLFAAAPFVATAEPLQFEETLKEVHIGIEDKTVSVDFPFRNAGPSIAKIRKADAGCSCMSVQVAGGKLRYEPGEKGILRATFEVGNFQGSVDKGIVLWLEGDPESEPSTQLIFRIHIPTLIVLEPKTVEWQVGNQAVERAIDISINHNKPIRVLRAESSSSAFQVKLHTMQEGKKYRLAITPKNTHEPAIGIIRIDTDSESPRHRVQQAFAVVKQPLSHSTPASQ